MNNLIAAEFHSAYLLYLSSLIDKVPKTMGCCDYFFEVYRGTRN